MREVGRVADEYPLLATLIACIQPVQQVTRLPVLQPRQDEIVPMLQ